MFSYDKTDILYQYDPTLKPTNTDCISLNSQKLCFLIFRQMFNTLNAVVNLFLYDVIVTRRAVWGKIDEVQCDLMKMKTINVKGKVVYVFLN
jgi:hypothetical protein